MAANKQKSDTISRIVFRVVTALIALTIIPAAYYLSIVKVTVDAKILDYGIGEEMSIKELSRFFDLEDIRSFLEKSSSPATSEALKPLVAPLICFVIFFSLALIMSLVIFFFAVFSNMKKTVFFESIGGVALTIAAIVSFNRAAGMILNGTVSVKNLLGNGLAGGIVDLLLNVNTLHLGSAPFIIIFSFVAIIAWAGSYLLTELGE